MELLRVGATVGEDGAVHVDVEGLPPGEQVDVIVVPKGQRLPRTSLYGTILKYERPFDPVAEDEWEVLK